MIKNETTAGILVTIMTYLLWGLLPIYWKLFDRIPPLEVLAHRVIWSLVFMSLILLMWGKWKTFLQEVQALLKQPTLVLGVIAATGLISLNWLIFIWAVVNEHVVQTSFGYYINPLISVLLGLLFLRESMSGGQKAAVGLAATGVAIVGFHFGEIPWIALLLAFSFGFYGLLKKVLNVGALTGLTLETCIAFPLAFGYVIYLGILDQSNFHLHLPATVALFIGAGVMTAVPLLLFAFGAKRIPLAMVGFLQYIAPTLMLFLGVLIYGEPFATTQWVAFGFIWAALGIYSFSTAKTMAKFHPRAG